MLSIHARKDLRMLKPEWVTGLLLATSPLTLIALGMLVSPTGRPYTVNPDVTAFFLFLTCTWIASAIFGKENLFGTTDQLLSQPLTRSDLWKHKLAIAVLLQGTVVLVYLLCHYIASSWANVTSTFAASNPFIIVTFVVLSTFGPGLFYSTCCRSFNEAFWLTALTPPVMMLALYLFVPEPYVNTTSIAFFITYGVATLIGTPLRIRRWEPTRGSFGNLSLNLPMLRLKSAPIAADQAHDCSPIRTIIGKELRLQQLNVIITFVLAVSYGGAIYGLSEYHWRFDLTTDSILILHLFTLLIAASVGATAIAEEHAYGVLSWQRALPISPRIQWALKLLVVFFLSFVLCNLIMWPVDYWARHTVGIVTNGIVNDQVQYSFFTKYIMWAGPLLAGLIGFYASAMSRSYLQAIMLTILLVFLGLLQVQLITTFIVRHATIPPLPLVTVLLPLILVPLLIYGSTKPAPESDSLRNKVRPIALGWVMSSLASVLTAQGIMTKAWESWIAPPAITERAPQISAKAQIHPGPGGFTILAGNGSLWHLGVDTPSTGHAEFRNQLTQWNTDTDWQSIVSSFRHRWAIKQDGTLWTWPSSLDYKTFAEGEAPTPIQLGKNLNWRQISLQPNDHLANVPTMALALTKDGKLFSHDPRESNDQLTSIPLDVSLSFIRTAADVRLGITTRGQLILIGDDPESFVTSRTNSQPPNGDESPSYQIIDSATDWKAIHVIDRAIFLRDGRPPGDISPPDPKPSDEWGTYPLIYFEKTDGTFFTPEWIARRCYGESSSDNGYNLHRLGQDPWAAIQTRHLASEQSYFPTVLVGLKMNGTLWERTQYSGTASENNPPFRNQKANRFGPEISWAAMSGYYQSNTFVGISENDLLWVWGKPLAETVLRQKERPMKIKLIPDRRQPLASYDLRTGLSIR